MKYTIYRRVTLHQYSHSMQRARSLKNGKWNTWFSATLNGELEIYVPDTCALLLGAPL